MQSDVSSGNSTDIYYAKTPAILCIGCDAYAESIIDNLRRMDTSCNCLCYYNTNYT